MATILDEIVARKHLEVAEAKTRITPEQLFAEALRSTPLPLFGAELRKAEIGIIAEIKKASPSAGVIREDFDPISIAKIYHKNGANALSILTDEHFFQGKLEYLTAVRSACPLPALRKEFIIDPYQIMEAAVAGAHAILLIAEILDDVQLPRLVKAAKSLGLEVLLEFHDADQLSRVVDAGANFIGINNRDLHTFKTRLDHTLDLMPRLPKDAFVVSESGIRTREDVLKLQQAGVKAILVGESLMRSPDIGAALRTLRGGE